MSRIFFNYLRMAITFICGIAIIKIWLDFSLEAYNAYLLATFGLGLAIVLREWVRLALVPIQKGGAGGDLGGLVSLCLGFGGLNLVVISLIALNVAAFNIADEFLDGFAIYLLVRALLHILVFYLLPLINHSLSCANPKFYNFFLAGERLLELFSVVVALYFHETYDSDVFLALAGLNAFSYVFLFLCFVFSFRRYYPTTRIIPSFRFGLKGKGVGEQLEGNFYLVANMALYFRLSVALANAIFEPMVAVVVGVAVQVAGYIRQITMGVMTGIDSYFAGRGAGKGVSGLKTIDSINVLVLTVSAGGSIFLSPLIVSFLLPDHFEGDIRVVALVLQFIVFGVYIKSLSEGWMHYLRGMGLVRSYAKPIFALAIFSPVVWFFIYWFKIEYPAIAYGVAFVGLMFVSHLVILPAIFKKNEPRSSEAVISSVITKSFLPLMIGFLYIVYMAATTL